PDEQFEVGGSRVLRSSDEDDVTIIGTGITVHEALKAADALEEDGVAVRVIDAYSIKPIDADTLEAAAEVTGRLVTVEDHFPAGGAIRIGLVGAWLDDRVQRRGRGSVAEPLERDHRGAAERRLLHIRSPERPPEHVGHDLDPVRVAEQRAPGDHDLLEPGQQVG